MRSFLFFWLSVRILAFLNLETRGMRWLNALCNVRRVASIWKCFKRISYDWSRTRFFGFSISFIKSSLIFLGRPLRCLPVRRKTVISRRFRCFNQCLFRSCLISSCSHIFFMITSLDRVSMTWKKRVFLMISASCLACGCGGGVDDAMVEWWFGGGTGQNLMGRRGVLVGCGYSH